MAIFRGGFTSLCSPGPLRQFTRQVSAPARSLVFSCPGVLFEGSELQGEFVTLTTVQARCPSCQSTEVFYSCSPNCCFNHVCSECQSSFELSTSPLPGSGQGLDMDASGLPPEPDACSPTAPCAKCQGIRVYQLSGGETLFCLDCRTLLKLGYENVAGP